MNRVIVTGAGSPGGPGIIASITKNHFVVAADMNVMAAGANLANCFELIPNATSENFLPEMLKLVKKHAIEVIIPLVTKELEVFANNVSLFKALNCVVVVNNLDVLALINNKASILNFLKSIKLKVPNFEVCTTKNQVFEAIDSLHYPEKVVCLKPAVSNGSRGFRILDNTINYSDLFWNYKPDNAYTNLEWLDKALSESFNEILVMEYLPGAEYTVDCLCNNGEALLVLPRVRTAMRAGISVAGTFVNHTEIIENCITIINRLKLNGPIGFQFKENEKGEPLLLEINPRLQGTSIAAEGLGISIPNLTVDLALHKPIKIPKIAWGLHFARYYTEVFFSTN